MVLSWLPMAARGQTITDLADIDLTGLAQPTEAKALRYWFDDDAGSVKTSDALSGKYALDVSGLIEGLHTVHYQVIDNEDAVAYVSSCVFLKVGSDTETTTVKSLRYWFDDDAASVQRVTSGSVQTVDVSSLLDGLHTIHYQLVGADGQAYYVASGLFMKTGGTTESGTVTASKLMYWFDDETSIQFVDVTGGVQLLDASELTEGLHTIHYQMLCSNGQMTPASSSIFLRMAVDVGTAVAKSLRYWFDDEQTATAVPITDGVQMLDASGLPEGLHTLNYQLIDSNDRVSVPVTRLFMKDFDKVLSDGKNRITKYQYWLNRNSQNLQAVDVPNATSPYTLIALLPMQKEPIQSSQFHFEVTDNAPTLYAKNTLHVRFYDARDYFTDSEKPFIDYRVEQTVLPVGELQATQRFDKVAENEIRWYTMQAAAGDTTAFKLSQPATVQVFSPSGKEVFKTSGSASVNWAGIHTWEDGTYYLAVHDVTGSQANMYLDYLHMDKYDVVDWDVHTVGNGGCSTITFKGNGFRDLYAVDLFTAEGDTIHSLDVSHDSDAETAVTFDFTAATRGDYNAVFHFAEENKLVAHVVTVEEAVDIELATSVSYPSTFLNGSSVTYTVNIKNNGNMTAYAVPVIPYITYKTNTTYSRYHYHGSIRPPLADIIDTDGWSDEDKRVLQDMNNSIGDGWASMKFQDKSGSGNDGDLSETDYLFINIPPGGEGSVSITFNDVCGGLHVSFSTPEKWKELTPNGDNENNNPYCCVKEGIECFADLVNSRLDVTSTVISAISLVDTRLLGPAQLISWADCAVSAANTALKAYGDFACKSDEETVKAVLAANSGKYFKTTIGATLSCIGAHLEGLRGTVTGGVGAIVSQIKFGEIMGSVVRMVTQMSPFEIWKDGVECIKRFQNTRPECLSQQGGSSTPVPPSDPNDIYGYLSDAGSKFIADSVARVNYTIEFENDTAFAQASAHTIIIKDTLDAKHFDLNSFLPTAVKIGMREVFIDESEVLCGNRTKGFLKTIDMRPDIDAIAQVEGMYDMAGGIAEWRFTSLDPMTMEPTDEIMKGILPVNYDGTSGVGEVMFQVGVKPNKGDGTEIANRAGIVFDYEEAILTPTWVNTVDAVAPTSSIAEGIQANDSTLTLRLVGSDNRSGVWKYDVYAQFGAGTSWELVAANVTDTLCDVRIYEDIDYGFCVLATDSAGNAERKEFLPELSFTTELLGDANGDGRVDLTDAIMIVYHSLGESQTGLDVRASDVNRDGRVDLTDAILVVYKSLGAAGSGTSGTGAEWVPE